MLIVMLLAVPFLTGGLAWVLETAIRLLTQRQKAVAAFSHVPR